MNSIWEYIIPTFIIALFGGFMAHKRNRNPLLWFLLVMCFNLIPVIILGGESVKTAQNKYVEVESDPNLSGGLITSAVLSFLWSLLFLITQVLFLIYSADKAVDYFIIGWNALIIAGYVAIGVGILQLRFWSYTWGVGLNIINILTFLIYHENPIAYVLIVINIAILALLVIYRKDFGGVISRHRNNNAQSA